MVQQNSLYVCVAFCSHVCVSTQWSSQDRCCSFSSADRTRTAVSHNLFFISTEALINEKERKSDERQNAEGSSIIPANAVLLLIMKPTEVKHQRPSNTTRRRWRFSVFFHFRIRLQMVAVFLCYRRSPFVFWTWRQLSVGVGIKMPELLTMEV